MTKKDGGPAFGHGDPERRGDPGMSLRDWFAGQALAGMHISSEPFRASANDEARWVTRRAYAIADAMLAARPAPGEGGEHG